MNDNNGTHVTWRELNLLRETIDRRFDALEELLREKRASRRAWFPPLIAALIAGFVSFPAYFMH
jgi:hypothetical protein